MKQSSKSSLKPRKPIIYSHQQSWTVADPVLIGIGIGRHKNTLKYLHKQYREATRQQAAKAEPHRMHPAYHGIRGPLIPNHVTEIQTL